MTGTPGLCIATLGPGATNLTTGVGCAYLDRSPLIAITCNLYEAQIGRRIQMWIDHEALFKPITKASFKLRAGTIGTTLAEALRIALTEPQGPVHLDLPEDVALAEADEMRAVGSVPSPRTEIVPDLTKTADILRRARRPIAVIGASAMRMQRPEALREFVERHRMPFATTTMAKGLIDEDHPLSLGCIERACRQVQRRFIQGRADLVVGLGYDTIEVEYEAWTGRLPVLHVDIQAADVESSVNVVNEVVGDLDASVAALAALELAANAWPEADVAEHRAAFHEALRPFTLRQAQGERVLQPYETIDAVRRVLPPNGVLAFDVGAHTHQ